MRTSLILCSIPLLALAACHANVDIDDADANGSDGNVHVAMNTDSNKVSVAVPGFNANISMPNLNLGQHLDLDGIKVAPDTKAGTIDVTSRDNDGAKDDGNVRVGFTNPAAPAAILDHYARSAADAGYGGIVRTGGSLSAKKDEKSFTVTVTPQGTGSQGTIVIAGKG